MRVTARLDVLRALLSNFGTRLRHHQPSVTAKKSNDIVIGSMEGREHSEQDGVHGGDGNYGTNSGQREEIDAESLGTRAEREVMKIVAEPANNALTERLERDNLEQKHGNREELIQMAIDFNEVNKAEKCAKVASTPRYASETKNTTTQPSLIQMAVDINEAAATEKCAAKVARNPRYASTLCEMDFFRGGNKRDTAAQTSRDTAAAQTSSSQREPDATVANPPSETAAATVPTTLAPTPTNNSVWTWDLPFPISNTTMHVLIQDPFGNETAVSKAYLWVLQDPYRQNYSEQRLLQRFVMAVFYFSTIGEEWIHQGGGTVTIAAEAQDGNGGSPPRGNSTAGRPPQGNSTGSRPPGGNSNNGGQGGGRMLCARQTMQDVIPRVLQQGTSTQPGITWINITSERWLSYSNSSSECDWYSTEIVRGHEACNGNNSLTFLGIKQNNIQGSLPGELGLLTSLEILDISRNSIGDTIPTEIFALSKLWVFTLYQNQLQGTVPSEIGLLSDTLENLSLRNNVLTGTLPQELFMLSNLKHLGLSSNRLMGSLPSDIGFRLPKLSILDFSRSLFGGTLPSSIGLLTAIRDLGFHNTGVSGTLPTELGGCANLERLLGQESNFYGTLPSELGMLTSLQTINVQGNPGLIGNIPFEFTLLNRTLQAFKIGGTSITGTIPQDMCGINHLSFDCSESLCGCDCACPEA
ncbi:Leucine Rich Repeat [Seminavis robusta]|uniref:Leucine Rich Repeat n=1 Tax=Seminavis robusta TaxID=568900 RepID=A0A9N8E016_9STRA|nr:Leucine Rich Repeat [Seminavis robusta]|eukprot:Sro377_g130080.1 Leucine Rich Repeat (696) ;mRNA; f:32122-34951